MSTAKLRERVVSDPAILGGLPVGAVVREHRTVPFEKIRFKVGSVSCESCKLSRRANAFEDQIDPGKKIFPVIVIG
jgi:hypothetical protein